MFLNAFKNLFTTKTNKTPFKKGIPRRLELLSLENRITPTTFTVNTTADTVDPTDSLISLREAIDLANTTPGNDQISFNLTGSSSYIITLATALPNIIDATSVIFDSNNQPIGTAGTVTINGLGATVLIINGDNNDNNRDFNIFKIDTGGNLSISGVEVSGAKTSGSGGAFNNSGTLTVSNSTISGNIAGYAGGGIDNNGTLTVNNSTISDNSANYFGGGISHYSGNLTVTDSTISGNTVSKTNNGTINTYNNGSQSYGSFYGANGGGLYLNSGTVTISNSTISGNTASFTNTGTLKVGNIYAGNGGGISIYNATVTISNSTISGNSAKFTDSGTFTKSNFYLGYGGGICNNFGTLNIANTTISGNTANTTLLGNSSGRGGGIYNNVGTLNIANTIIANSTDGASTPSPIDDYSGGGNVNLIPSGDTNDPTTLANNIVTLDTNTNTSTNTSAWAIVVTSADLNLGPLQNNGGPTETMALTNLTPVSVTAGGNATISNASPIFGLDQRGVTRSSTAPSIGAFEYYAAPTVSSILPVSGLVAGGTIITITGTGFTGATGVTIGGVAATNLVVNSPTSITVTTPAHAAGTASVLVTTPGGTNTANTLFTYVAAPTVASISPTSGPVTGGTNITITGSDFTGASAVTIDGTAATNVIVVTATTITATTPAANAAGTASVVVTTSGGANAANTLFTYVAAPTVASISPTSGLVAGGTIITITGTGFTGATGVTIGGVAATNLVVNSPTSITVTTPAHAAGTASVLVTTLGGTNTANTLFTYVAAPSPTPTPTPTPTPSPTAPLVTGTPPPTSSGGSSTVTLYDPITGEPTGTAVPFPGFSGPVKVVSGDFNNDGVADIIAGAGFGGGPAIAILNSQTGEVMETFFAFDPAFTGGVFVAVQDVNNDGILDVIASAGPGGGPEVRIFDGSNLNVLRSFFAYAEDFSGGVSVASIDFNNDGILDLVTGAGPGGGPHVKVFDGATNAIISQWYAYATDFTGGVYVAAGDIGNDGTFEVVTGAGQGGAPVVAVWDPYTGALLSQFMAYAEDFTGGVRVGINDGNSDGIADIVTGAGPGGGPQVNVFSFPALDLLFSFYSGDPSNTGGVFVS